MDIDDLPERAKKRLERIRVLKRCTEKQALDFAIYIGWLQVERQAEKAARREKIPESVIWLNRQKNGPI